MTLTTGNYYTSADWPAVEAARIVPGALPGTAGVVGAVATFRLDRGLGLDN